MPTCKTDFRNTITRNAAARQSCSFFGSLVAPEPAEHDHDWQHAEHAGNWGHFGATAPALDEVGGRTADKDDVTAAHADGHLKTERSGQGSETKADRVERRTQEQTELSYAESEQRKTGCETRRGLTATSPN